MATFYEMEDNGNMIPYLTDGDLYMLKDLNAQYLQMPPGADMNTNSATVNYRIQKIYDWYGHIENYFESIVYGTRKDIFQKYIDYDKTPLAISYNQTIKKKIRLDTQYYEINSLPERKSGARQWFLRQLNPQDRNLRYEILKAADMRRYNDNAFITMNFLEGAAVVAAVVAVVYTGGVAAGAWGGTSAATTSAGVAAAAGTGGAAAGAGAGTAVVGTATPAGGILGGTGLLSGASTAGASGGIAGGSGLLAGSSAAVATGTGVSLASTATAGGGFFSAAGNWLASTGITELASTTVLGYAKDEIASVFQPKKNETSVVSTNPVLSESQKSNTALVAGLGLLVALLFI